MERREALAAYNDVYKEQDDLYRAVARQCGLSDCAFWVLYALRESGHPTVSYTHLTLPTIA